MGFYDEIVDETVIPIIEEMGATLSFSRSGDTSEWVREYDEDTMGYVWRNTNTEEIVTEEPIATETIIETNAIRVNYENDMIDGTLIKKGDFSLLVINMPAPELGDIYTFGGVTVTYINHETVSPAGVPILYKIQVR